MDKIRLGNDIEMRWSIFTRDGDNKVPYDLEGRELTLSVVNRTGESEIEFFAKGNIVTGVFRGRDQKILGKHGVILRENNGGDGMRTVDACDAFELVACSCEEALGSPGTIQLFHLTFDTTIGAITGTIDPILNHEAEQAEAERKASEIIRKIHEEARQEAEAARQKASSEAVATANAAAENAQQKAEEAASSAASANSAAENAQQKAQAAQDAAVSANGAALDANSAAENAQQKADEANGAAASANTAAEAAGTAAGRANEAADKFASSVVQQQGNAADKVISQKAVTDALGGKQDIIPDLESIREGAGKGSTALQKESDPVYLADRPSLLLNINGKVDKVAGKGLSRNDFTDEEKSKLAGLENYDDTEVRRLKFLLGFNADRSTVTLEAGESGKYVKCESRSAVANSAFAISKPFAVDACSELFIKTGFNPSDASHASLDLSIIATYEEIKRQRTVQKKDASGNPLYYVVTVDAETGSETVTTDETTENTGYPVYVMETYTEARYLPNNEDRFVEIPDSGYYVANIPQSCKVVVSYKPGVSDTAVIVEKHGAIANLISQVFGIYEHRTMVEAMVSLAARVDALEARQGLLGNATAGTLDVSELTKCLYPTILRGHGVPSATNVPDNLPAGLPWDGVPVFIGQLYINLDAASGGLYYAVGHDSVSNWKQA